MNTYTGWTMIEVAKRVRPEQKEGATGDARYIRHETRMPTAEWVEKMTTAFGMAEGLRMAKQLYLQLSISNRPNPKAKAPKRVNADSAMATMTELAEKYVGEGLGFKEALAKARDEASHAAPAVAVDWITKQEYLDLKNLERETLAGVGIALQATEGEDE